MSKAKAREHHFGIMDSDSDSEGFDPATLQGEERSPSVTARVDAFQDLERNKASRLLCAKTGQTPLVAPRCFQGTKRTLIALGTASV